MKIIVNRECDSPTWSQDTIERLARYTLTAEGAPDTTELSVTLVDIDQMTELNEGYRHREGPTDVLSFPMDDAYGNDEPDGKPVAIGDIVIAPQVAADQAPGYGNTFEDEMRLLLVHGVLHLLGYDHLTDEEAEVMEAREREILRGFADGDKGQGGAEHPKAENPHRARHAAHGHGDARRHTGNDASARRIRAQGRARAPRSTDPEHDGGPSLKPGADDLRVSDEDARRSYEQMSKGEASLLDKFSFAGQGIVSAFTSERNLRIHTCVGVLALVLAAILHVRLWGWVAILICIALVIFAELFNTAIEAVVNLASPGYNKLAKRAKDIAAGAVLVLAVISVIIGLAIYLDAFNHLMGG